MGYVLLIYDIPDDGIRHKISERCKDYGLSRIQTVSYTHLTLPTTPYV